MDKLFEWLKAKKNWKWLIIGAFSIFFVPLIMIHLLFKIPYINEFFKSEWSAGEALEYVGSFYALLGTAIFSGLALWQNRKYRLLLDEENKLRNMPELLVDIARCNGLFTNINLSVSNNSENIAKAVTISEIKILHENGEMLYTNANLYLQTLRGGDKREIEVKNPPLKGSNFLVTITVKFEDKFFEWHEFATTIFIADPNIIDYKRTMGSLINIDNPTK